MGPDNIVPDGVPARRRGRLVQRAGPILATLAASPKRFLCLRATPVMATGAANHVWRIAEIGALASRIMRFGR